MSDRDEPQVHAGALRNYAKQVRATWVPFTDSDLSDMAEQAARDLERLALRIERHR